MSRLGPRVRLGAVVLLLAVTAWSGFVEGWNAARNAATTGQHVAAVTQVAYGVLALLAFPGVLARRRWSVPILALWGVALTATATLAPVVWGGAPWQAALAAGASTAVVAGLVLWGGRRHLATADAPSPR